MTAPFGFRRRCGPRSIVPWSGGLPPLWVAFLEERGESFFGRFGGVRRGRDGGAGAEQGTQMFADGLVEHAFGELDRGGR